uniref:(northern house mosquito) hypothetical protein n=1 Tax=Culex pipiens TaxID=7175 RepID=A0A8D8CMC8_CULPI
MPLAGKVVRPSSAQRSLLNQLSIVHTAPGRVVIVLQILLRRPRRQPYRTRRPPVSSSHAHSHPAIVHRRTLRRVALLARVHHLRFAQVRQSGIAGNPAVPALVVLQPGDRLPVDPLDAILRRGVHRFQTAQQLRLLLVRKGEQLG